MYTKMTALEPNKAIALVAHDNKKDEIIEWVEAHRQELSLHKLYATGTTGSKIERQLGIEVEKLISGPMGGDQQIGAKIANGEINFLVFFWDPFEPLPHDPDVKALLRVAAVWNIPVACNRASADFLLTSPLMQQSYQRLTPDYERYIKERLES